MSALHRDHYENIYCTLEGEKHFTLLPPFSTPYLRQGEYLTTRLKPQGNAMGIDEDTVSTTRWLGVNPDNPQDIAEYQLEKLQKYHVVLKSGDVLYLPSLWYHQVAQHHPEDAFVVACNYWWDMDYGSQHALDDQTHQDTLSQF